jgi:hypothetical protein
LCTARYAKNEAGARGGWRNTGAVQVGGGGGVQQRQRPVPPPTGCCAHHSGNIIICPQHPPAVAAPATHRECCCAPCTCCCWTRRNDCCFAGCFDYSAPTPTTHPPHLLLLHPLHRLVLHPLHFGDCFTHWAYRVLPCCAHRSNQCCTALYRLLRPTHAAHLAVTSPAPAVPHTAPATAVPSAPTTASHTDHIYCMYYCCFTLH